MKRFKLLSILMFSFLLLVACGGNESEAESSNQNNTIKIGLDDWSENIAVSNMWKIILENRGYDVSLVDVDKQALFEGLAGGNVDIGMEVWLPKTDSSYYQEYENNIDWREVWYEDTDLALVVPSYVENVNSIEDLNAHKEQFDSEIISVEPDSSIMELTERVIDEYNLDLKLVPSSEITMLEELDNYVNHHKQPILVTLWKPHWAFEEMDLKALEDPKNVYGELDNISYATRIGLEEDHPEVVEWLDNFVLSEEELSSLMIAVNEAESEQDGVNQWIDNHQDLINEWVGE